MGKWIDKKYAEQLSEEHKEWYDICKERKDYMLLGKKKGLLSTFQSAPNLKITGLLERVE